RGSDRWLDFVEQLREVAELGPIDRPLYGAAGGAAHDEHELGSRCGTGELQAPEQIIVADVAGDARVEGVADAGVEDDLRRCARVDAAEDRGGGVLSTEGGALLREIVVRVHLPGTEALVAALEQREHLFGGELVTLLAGERLAPGQLPAPKESA